MASTWWSQRFTQVLESYGLGARMQRGRRYARTGQVLGLDVQAGVIAAQVQGSRRTPYLVTIALREPTDNQWQAIDTAISAKVGFAARLLAGEVPPDLDDVFRTAGVTLFPDTWADLRSACSCPDWENPCKHIAAVLYIFADQLDTDPWLILAWRGRTRDQILDGIRAPTIGSGVDEIAPWWPFAPGPLPFLNDDRRRLGADDTSAPERADATLDAMDDLRVPLRAGTFVDALRHVYPHIVEADDLDDGEI